MLTSWERVEIAATKGRKKREEIIDAMSEEDAKLLLKEVLGAMHQLADMELEQEQ